MGCWFKFYKKPKDNCWKLQDLVLQHYESVLNKVYPMNPTGGEKIHNFEIVYPARQKIKIFIFTSLAEMIKILCRRLGRYNTNQDSGGEKIHNFEIVYPARQKIRIFIFTSLAEMIKILCRRLGRYNTNQDSSGKIS